MFLASRRPDDPRLQHNDAEHHLIQVDGSNGWCASGTGTAATACYTYDAEGRRVRRAVPGDGITDDYLYDLSGHFITQVSGQGSWVRGEIYAGGQHIATYENDLATPTTFFTHADQLGTERVQTAVNGSSCETITNLPFGDGMNETGSCDPTQARFTGKQRDFETNLDNFGARYNSSSLGRFMSADPVGGRAGNPQTLNKYAYVVNNPLRFVDPFGYWHCVWSDNGGSDDTPENGGATESECFSQDPDATWESDAGDACLLGGTCTCCSQNVQASAPGSGGNSENTPAVDTQGEDTEGESDIPLDIWHCPGCANIWQATYGSMNAITTGYVAIYGGAFLSAAGAPYAASLAARGIGWGYAMYGGGTAAIVLGGYPEYVDEANAIGAHALDIPGPIWNTLNFFGETWTANKAFIDTAVKQGYSVYLASSPGSTNFWLEMQYLTERGIDPASLPVATVPH